MKRALWQAMLVVVAWGLPAAANGGWVAQWVNTSVRGSERMAAENSSMYIEGGRVRLVQPQVVSIIDYRTGKYTLMNPARKYFWSGTADEYVADTTRRRNEALRARLGKPPTNAGTDADSGKEPAAPKSDPTTWPVIAIKKTDLTKKIAGYDTVKYDVLANNELFQEIWIAPALDLSADLDVERFVALQQKLSAAMVGKPAGAYNALYANPEYRKLIEKSFALQIITHFTGGSFERVVTEVRQAAVPPDDFEVPDSYRRVRLADVLATESGG